MSREEILKEKYLDLVNLEERVNLHPNLIVAWNDLQKHMKKNIDFIIANREAEDYYTSEICYNSRQIYEIGKQILEIVDNDTIRQIITPLQGPRNLNEWFNIYSLNDSICFQLAFQISLHTPLLDEFIIPLFNLMSFNIFYGLTLADQIRIERGLDIIVAVDLNNFNSFVKLLLQYEHREQGD